mgnify:CR=1 FL=1
MGIGDSIEEEDKEDYQKGGEDSGKDLAEGGSSINFEHTLIF